jgi:carboxylesterase type B
MGRRVLIMNWKRAAGRMVFPVIAVLLVAGCAAPAAVSTPLVPEGRYQETVFESAACESDIVYREATDQNGETVQLLLDVYQPEGDTATDRPAIVILHAGSFIMGSKDAGLEPVLAKGLAKEG